MSEDSVPIDYYHFLWSHRDPVSSRVTVFGPRHLRFSSLRRRRPFPYHPILPEKEHRVDGRVGVMLFVFYLRILKTETRNRGSIVDLTGPDLL